MGRIVSVVGPTASGKTALSVAIAKKLSAEIVSVDSMQIYRKMDIGTAKATPEEQDGIVHHMIDCMEPTENCSVQKFVRAARTAVNDILFRGKNCVLAGGTGLYIDHLISDTQFVDVPTDAALREQLNALEGKQLYEQLMQADPACCEKLHPNDKKRIVRALEIIKLTGKSIRYWEALSHQGSQPLDVLMIGLNFADRAVLYERIDRRVDIMIRDGLVDEVRSLMQLDGFLTSTACDGIGYREIVSYLSGDCSLETATELIKKNTRHYAKRQLTWFRRNPDIHWIEMQAQSTSDDILKQAMQIIERNS